MHVVHLPGADCDVIIIESGVGNPGWWHDTQGEAISCAMRRLAQGVEIQL